MNNTIRTKKKSDLKFVYSENSTVSIIFSRNEDLLGVAGEFNNNIKELEKNRPLRVSLSGLINDLPIPPYLVSEWRTLAE